MKRALKLAVKGEGWVSPNPMVGAVIVKDGRILGEGYHQRFGGNHAEVNALNALSEPAAGATMYVTLEPCSHYGKTPPCVDAIIERGLGRVVIGVPDPNPAVSGRGIGKLQQHGVDITVGVLEDECRYLNERFFRFMTAGVPFVTLKCAQTLDGRIATSSGHSRWVSSEPSLKFAHRLRACHDAILVGIGTVFADDPELTVRRVGGRNPVRVVLDSRLKISLDARVLREQEKTKTLVAVTPEHDAAKRRELEARGVETIVIPGDINGHVALPELLAELGRRTISSVLVEGGAKIITAFLKAEQVDRFVAITAPKVLGRGIETVGNLGSIIMGDAIQFTLQKVSRRGDDVIMDYRMKRKD